MWPFSSPYPEHTVRDILEEYDYIVVGGGTAGCVLANRLSASPSVRVLVVERGPVADSWPSRVPLFSSDFASDGSRTAKDVMVPQPELRSKEGMAQNRVVSAFSGAALGGTSRINGMIYSRGLPAEYDRWAEAGLKGWGWADMRGYFLKSERSDVSVQGVHSQDGLWKNTTHPHIYFRGFSEAIEAAQQVGLPYIPDLNSPSHPPFGCAALHFIIDEKGHRHSTYRAFVPKEVAIARRNHLHVCTNTTVEKLLTERTLAGELIVTGIVLASSDKSASGRYSRIVKASKEVVLCAGALRSPHILMLSGIGPAEHLKDHGIPVVHDLPAVGSNLQDHFATWVGFNIDMGDSLLQLQKRIWSFLFELIRYLIWGTGLLMAPVLQLAVFTNSKLLDSRGFVTKSDKAFEETLPDLEIMPIAYDCADPGSGLALSKARGTYSFLNVLLAPRSRGTVRLSSSDPRAAILIDPRYLSDAADLAPLRASLKLSLRLRDEMRKRGYAMANGMVPVSESDEDLDAWIRLVYRTTYHYTSTCRMGRREDPEWDGGAVVDERLKVYGVEGLRIADASVFPWVPRCHTQAPTVAVAEKCADMMLEDDL